jgi:hypothetical protein
MRIGLFIFNDSPRLLQDLALFNICSRFAEAICVCKPFGGELIEKRRPSNGDKDTYREGEAWFFQNEGLITHGRLDCYLHDESLFDYGRLNLSQVDRLTKCSRQGCDLSLNGFTGITPR